MCGDIQRRKMDLMIGYGSFLSYQTLIYCTGVPLRTNMAHIAWKSTGCPYGDSAKKFKRYTFGCGTSTGVRQLMDSLHRWMAK